MSTGSNKPANVIESRLKVLFICRGSASDGLGHVMRSGTVAHAMIRTTIVKMIVIGDEYVNNVLADKGFNYIVVANDEQAMLSFHEFNPAIVIFDLLQLNETNFETISQSTMTISLSPIFNRLLGVDMIFHRTSITGKDWQVTSPRPLIRSGLEYAIINENCYLIPEDIYQQNLEHEILSLAISMGGTDAANKTLQVLNIIKQIPGKLLLWVMLGEGYAHSYQDLVECMRGSKHSIILAKTNDSIWRVLSTCSLAILAGGIMTYEAAYAGLPSVNTLESDQHFFLIQELVDRGACLCAGQTFNESLIKLTDIVSHLNNNRNELLQMHKCSRGLIDGLGSQKVINEIQQYYFNYQAHQQM